jgi:hypothetical protein
MNYGETLAYWYLRLNGFIPLTNLVLHAPDDGNRRNSDMDLIAVRFPHAFEIIGGDRGDYDPRLTQWNLDIFNSVVCLVVEVKTGGYTNAKLNQSFSEDRLGYAIKRLGMINPEEASLVAERLNNEQMIVQNPFVFAKLLVHAPELAPRVPRRRQQCVTPCFKLPIRDAADFIKARMRLYREHKGVARLLFPGDLIQYLAWSEGIPQVVENEVE